MAADADDGDAGHASAAYITPRPSLDLICPNLERNRPLLGFNSVKEADFEDLLPALVIPGGHDLAPDHTGYRQER